MTDEAMSGIRVVYYFEKSLCVGPVATICLFIGKDQKLLARGISICSLYDQFNKKEGKKQSYKRARRAFGTKDTDKLSVIKQQYGDFYDPVVRKKRVYNEAEVENFIEDSKNHITIYKVIRNGDKKYIQYQIPYFHPLNVVSQFDFKSCYLPKPTDREVDEFRVS